MKYIIANNNTMLLGKSGENNVRTIRFPVQTWLSDFPDGLIMLIHQRAHDEYPYPCVITVKDGFAEWVITDVETSVVGLGKAELSCSHNGNVVKSKTYETYVSDAMETSTEVPDPYQSWVDYIAELADLATAVKNVTVSTVNLPAGAQATVNSVYDETTNTLNLEFGIPTASNALWGSILGDITKQLDLQSIVNQKANIAESASSLDFTINTLTYVLTATLKNKFNEVLSTQNIDLPIESMIINVTYDSTTKTLTFTLQNEQSINVALSDLVSGLVPDTRKINDKSLNADIQLSASDVGAYVKPVNGIPSTDLAESVQTSLEKADTAIQSSDLASVATSGSYTDLSNKPTIPNEVTEQTVAGWGFTKNTGNYNKPIDGIPKTDLSLTVQSSLDKADSAVQDVSGKQDKPTIVTSGTNITLTDNTEYALSNVSNLTLMFPSGNFECYLSIITASSGTVTITLPISAKYIGEAPVFGNSEEWEISVRNGVVIAAKVGDGT